VKEIQKADPQARRRAILILTLGTVIGCVLILLLEHHGPALRDWITQDPEKLAARAQSGLLISIALVSVPLLAFAAYLWRLGSRIARAERFPPPGLTVVRDTPVLRGRPARRRGRLAQALAGCLAFMACALPVVFWWLLKMLAPVLETLGT
jgi:hypothetical protein